MNYLLEAGLGRLAGATGQTAQARLDALLAAPLRMLMFHALFMTATAAIVARGVERGIEATCKILMPMLIGIIMLLAVASLATGDAGGALRFLFHFDLGRFSGRGALEALGLGFFSIGVGLGLMITYAAYAGP